LASIPHDIQSSFAAAAHRAAEHFDINPNGESFALMEELFERFGDICKVEPLTKAPAPAYTIHHPDYIKHVLVGRAQNYTKGGVGFERVNMLLGNGVIVSGGDFWCRNGVLSNCPPSPGDRENGGEAPYRVRRHAAGQGAELR
jgi:hypothetical protein